MPPSSAHTRFRLRAAALTVRLPTSVEPVNAILFKVGVLGERRASSFAAAHEDEDVDEAVWSIRFRDELAKAESHRSLFGEGQPNHEMELDLGLLLRLVATERVPTLRLARRLASRR